MSDAAPSFDAHPSSGANPGSDANPGSAACPGLAEPRLTVCLCTHNRPEYVRDCLAGMRKQTVSQARFTLLVVDSGSPTPAREQLAGIVAAHPDARLIRLDQAGVSLARNAGARDAGDGYIAYIDDDAIPAADWVERIVAAIRDTPKPP